MKPEDYPAQEPLSDFARPYHDEVLRRAEGLDGVETRHGDDPYQSLVLFEAADPSGDVLAVIHGGGWTNGYKEWMSFMAPALTARGVTVASLGYRLAPAHLFPSGYEDCLAGIAWLARNAGAHGGDPDRIFVGGHSAGGHQAALMAVRDDWQSALRLSSAVVRGCLPVSGVYEFREGSGLTMRPRFLGPEEAGMDAPASPLAHVTGPPPPFLIAYGDDDFPHLIAQAEAMEAALKSAGGDVASLVLEGCGHLEASLAAGDPEAPWVGAAVDWMRRH